LIDPKIEEERSNSESEKWWCVCEERREEKRREKSEKMQAGRNHLARNKCDWDESSDIDHERSLLVDC
jgi:hypothetical protein